MKSRLRSFALAAVPLCLLLLSGCSQDEGVHSPTAPAIGAPSGGDTSLGLGKPGLELGSPVKSPLIVQARLGSGGGILEAGQVSVFFPRGCLPSGKTLITLQVWSDKDDVFFTVEPADLILNVPAEFSFKLDPASGTDFHYYWNDKGWRETLPSWLNQDKTVLEAETDFLGEFVVCPTWTDKGRAGW